MVEVALSQCHLENGPDGEGSLSDLRRRAHPRINPLAD